jgi:hypothetical protein
MRVLQLLLGAAREACCGLGAFWEAGSMLLQGVPRRAPGTSPAAPHLAQVTEIPRAGRATAGRLLPAWAFASPAARGLSANDMLPCTVRIVQLLSLRLSLVR